MRGDTYFWSFLLVGILVQCITYALMPDSLWSLFSGLLGICSVVLGAHGNILTFVFGFAQVGTYTYLCVQERFYAEIALNIFYFITMIYGVYVWKKRLTKENSLQIHTPSPVSTTEQLRLVQVFIRLVVTMPQVTVQVSVPLRRAIHRYSGLTVLSVSISKKLAL